jgi:hypothetical protein
MLQHRRALADGNRFFRYLLVDSSPQVGYDWLWSQYKQISANRAVSVCRALNKLQVDVAVHAQRLRADDPECELVLEPLDSWKPLLALIADGISEHISPPTAVASGHRGLAHKARALVHQWYLELPAHLSMNDHADTFEAVCSDMGVEMSLPDFRAPDVESILPAWLNRDELRADLESGSIGRCKCLGVRA